jgi:hypothetical protein
MTDNSIDLPFGDAFSPAQLTTDGNEEALPLVLEMIEGCDGEPEVFDQAVADRFFSDSPDPLTRAENVRFALRTHSGYGLVNDDFEFTERGQDLYDLRDRPAELYAVFAEHILLNLHGLEVIESIRDLEALGLQTTEHNIRQHLSDHYGIQMGETSNHWSQMRAWLAKADIINTGVHVYDVDDERIEQIAGVTDSDLVVLDQLTSEQAAFLRTLAIVDPDSAIPNNRVRRAAEEAFGIEIQQSNIGRRVLDPLAELEYIEWEHNEGAPNQLWTTDQFDADVLVPVLEAFSDRVGVPKTALRQSFSDLDRALPAQSDDEHGQPLETLTAKFGYLLDLDFVGWSSRGEGNKNVTALFERTRTSYERWQLTCLDPEQPVRPVDVTQAVGTGSSLQASTVMIVSLQGVTLEARQLAARIMQRSETTILIVAIEDLSELDDAPSTLRNAVERETERVGRVKSLEDESSLILDEAKRLSLRTPSALEELEDSLNDRPPSAETATLDEFSGTDS